MCTPPSTACLESKTFRKSGWLAIVFLCRHVEGQPRPDGRETDAARYFGRDEIEQSAEPFEPWCQWLVSQVLSGRHQVIAERQGHPFFPSLGFL